jgi:phosphoglycolate phosphatase
MAKKRWPLAVVFDLDGTLIDSAPDIAFALNTALAKYGLAPFSIDDVKTMIGGGISKLAERALLARGALAVEPPALVSDFIAVYRGNLTARTVLYDGARELLERMAHDGIRLGLCSNKEQSLTAAILDRLDIARYFHCVIGEGLGFARKPDPEPLRATLRCLDTVAGDAVMVGDSEADIECARAAGVVSVAVTCGYSRIKPELLGADATVDRLLDLPACLEKLTPSR